MDLIPDLDLDLDFRTALRLFLVAAGVAYVIWGGLTGELFRVGLGVLAVGVGGAGLLRDRRSGATGGTD